MRRRGLKRIIAISLIGAATVSCGGGGYRGGASTSSASAYGSMPMPTVNQEPG